MNWSTIYITGKEGYNKEVMSHLEKSDLVFMPGTAEDERGISLYWIPEEAALREFKKAIGAKTIFKYRLHFNSSLDKMNENLTETRERFSPREEAMIREMNAWEKSQRFLHSA